MANSVVNSTEDKEKVVKAKSTQKVSKAQTKVKKPKEVSDVSSKQKRVANKKASKDVKAGASVKESIPMISDTYAIVRKGNAQYFLEQGALIEIPRINVPEGKEYKFEEVLLASIKNELKIGTPVIEGAYVKVFVIKQLKGEKQHGFKYKAKSRYRKTWGYRKPKTRIRVLEIKA